MRSTQFPFSSLVASGCAVVLLSHTGFAQGAAPPPTPPPAPVVVPADRTAAQDAAAALGKTVTNADIADFIKTSGLNEAQVRTRLQAAGYDPKLADPFFGGQTQTVTRMDAAANPAFAKALAELGMSVPDASPTPATADADKQNKTKPVAAVSPETRIFGKDVFSAASNAFDPDIGAAVDPSYRLGAGDQLQFVVTGQVELLHVLTVRPDGSVLIPTIGQVSVAGLTLESARTILKRQASLHYAGIADGKATLDLSVSKVRSILVRVLGDVENPGPVQLSGLATAFNALVKAGGPSSRGSFRDIELHRGSEVIKHIDLYDYLLNGDESGDVRLEQGDRLFVPLNRRAVMIRGAVRREGIFELRANEGFSTLLSFAGGVLPSASTDRIQIDRILPPAQRQPGLERVVIDVPFAAVTAPSDTTRVNDNDIVTVFSIGDLRRNEVVVDGAVFQPGHFEWKPGLTLGTLVDVAAGGSLPSALIDRVKVTRSIPRTGREEIYSLNLSDTASYRFPIQEFDQVRVLDGRIAYPAGSVSVAGAVVTPGTQRFVEQMRLKDAIDLANGLQPWALGDEIQLVRRIPETGKRIFVTLDYRLPDVQTYPLTAFDEIAVLDARTVQPAGSVLLLGGAYSTGSHPFAERMTVGDLIASAGGLLEGAKYVDVARPRRSLEYSDTISTLKRFTLNTGLVLPAEAATFRLEPFDQVVVRTGPGFREGQAVQVSGAFAYPGPYALERDDERVSSLYKRAGGILPSANKASIRLFRNGRPVPLDIDAALHGDPHQDIPLENGDELQVDQNTGVVLVSGSVERQVAVPFRDGWSIDDYIRAAGGFSTKADRGNIVLVYPSGAVTRIGSHFWGRRPSIINGSTISVGARDDGTKTDWTRALTVTLQVTTALSSLLLGYLAVVR